MEDKCKVVLKYFLKGFVICLLLILLCFNREFLIDSLEFINKLLAPFIYGLLITFIINPLESWIELKIVKFIKVSKRSIQVIRFVLTISIITGILITGLTVIPSALESCKQFLSKFPMYSEWLYNHLISFMNNHKDLTGLFITNIEDFEIKYANLEALLLNGINQLQPYFEKWIKQASTGVLATLTIIKNILLGIIVGIYIILNKELMYNQIDRVLSAILSEKKYNFTKKLITKINKTFIDFLVGKTLDSFIVFVLSFIVFSLTGIPDALLVSIIVGITNIIPCFGPFIGAIPCSFIVVLNNPNKVILFIVLILIIQQIDGNIIGVKILGNKLNLPSIWILFAILIFSSLFGVYGMILGVPAFAVIYDLTGEYIIKLKDRKLKENKNG